MATIRRSGKDYFIRNTKNPNVKVTFTHTCAFCDKDFISARTTARYCSGNCKQQAYYARNREIYGVGNISYLNNR